MYEINRYFSSQYWVKHWPIIIINIISAANNKCLKHIYLRSIIHFEISGKGIREFLQY